MPHLVAFGRKWNLGSDDFVFSGSADFIIRVTGLVIIIIVVCVFGSDLVEPSCELVDLQMVYFIGLMIFLFITAVIAAVTVYISKQGTIANDLPRKKLPRLLYIRTAIALPEVAWNIVGTVWAFQKSTGCSSNIVVTAKAFVISGWILLLIELARVIIHLDLRHTMNREKGQDTCNKKKKRKSRSVQSFKNFTDLSRFSDRLKVWEKRCKCLFCCVSADDRSASILTTVAELSAKFFEHADLVLTDVLAGLILISQSQEQKSKSLKQVVVTDQTSSLEKVVPKELMTQMSHYMKFALGSYGWFFYVTLTKPVLGACSLCTAFRCCSCSKQEDIVDDNCCQCATAAFKKTTGISHEDIVYASFTNDIYQLPFFVVIDKDYKTVVVAIRGTLSTEDIVTDLDIDRENLDLPDIPEAYAHKGILEAANNLRKTLDEIKPRGGKTILQDAFSRLKTSQGTRLVITGHSLGAGAAALLAVLLKPKYRGLKCFAFAAPGELVSKNVSKYCRDFVYTVVLGDDIVPRLGVLMMHDLKLQLIKAIKDCQIPKYKILARGCLDWCSSCCISAINKVAPGNRNNVQCGSGLSKTLADCLKELDAIKAGYKRLYLPGNILHIEEIGGNISTTWCDPEKFTEILVSDNMLAHHFPDKLLEILETINRR